MSLSEFVDSLSFESVPDEFLRETEIRFKELYPGDYDINIEYTDERISIKLKFIDIYAKTEWELKYS